MEVDFPDDDDDDDDDDDGSGGRQRNMSECSLTVKVPLNCYMCMLLD